MKEVELYRVVFSGKITEEFDLATTKRRFSKVFRLDSKEVDRLFSSQDVAIKSNVTEPVAMDLAMKLIKIGCECYIDLMPHQSDISHQPGFVERRKSARRQHYRRDPRAGSIVPDRRVLFSRRRIDMILLKKNGDFPGNSVKKPD